MFFENELASLQRAPYITGILPIMCYCALLTLEHPIYAKRSIEMDMRYLRDVLRLLQPSNTFKVTPVYNKLKTTTTHQRLHKLSMSVYINFGAVY